VTQAEHPEPEYAEDVPPIRLIAVVNAVIRRRWSLIGIVAVGVAISVTWALTTAESWTSSVRFLPVGGSSMTIRLGSIAGAGAGVLDSNEAGSDYFAELLKSSTFMESVAAEPLQVDAAGTQQLLAERWEFPDEDPDIRLQQTAQALLKSCKVTVAKAAASPAAPRLITVDISADSPQLAAALGTRILERIHEHNEEVRGARGRANREFVEKQLHEAREELARATDAFARFTARNRRLVTPTLLADRDRLEREVRVKEEVFLTLTRQAELVKIEEQDTRVSIEVIQAPEVPLQRTAPRRSQTVAMGTMLSLMAGLGWIYVSERLRRRDPNDPDTVELHRLLREARRDPLGLRARHTETPSSGR
jgi:uncharacterized protein involved in exopolysaccharide biosynthesis